jgi:intracellular sulfur oxidation DsrE/DsrF family protein
MNVDDRAGLVIHASSGGTDPDTALRYATNFATACGGSRPVDEVVNGPALNLVLRQSDWCEQVTGLQEQGNVTFSACANTMAAQGIEAADLHPAAQIVTAAVLHIAERQWAGWAYVRP